MNLICVTGIDGAGKTTLARSIAAALRQAGWPAVYVYGRIYPALSRLLMALGRATLLRKDDQWRDYRAYSTSKKQAMRSPYLAWPYTLAILLDYYVQIWWKLLPHLFGRRIVVSDRYIYDTVISDLTAHLDYSPGQTERAIERGLKLLPTPLLTILVDIPEEIAISRKTDVPHIDYLKERRGSYLALDTRPEVERIDGTNPPESVLQASLSRIVNHLRGDASA